MSRRSVAPARHASSSPCVCSGDPCGPCDLGKRLRCRHNLCDLRKIPPRPCERSAVLLIAVASWKASMSMLSSSGVQPLHSSVTWHAVCPRGRADVGHPVGLPWHLLVGDRCSVRAPFDPCARGWCEPPASMTGGRRISAKRCLHGAMGAAAAASAANPQLPQASACQSVFWHR